MTQIERLFDHSPMAEAVWSLRLNQCKYPIGDEHGFAFCPDKRAEGSSYCAHHHAISNVIRIQRTGSPAVNRPVAKPVRQKLRVDRPRKIPGPSGKLYTFDGASLSLSEWSRRIGISNSALRTRLRTGWTIEQALSTQPIQNGLRHLGFDRPVHPDRPIQPKHPRIKVETGPRPRKEPKSARRYEHNGQSLTLRQWSEQTGISLKAIRTRIKRGWPMEHVLLPVIDQHSRYLGAEATAKAVAASKQTSADTHVQEEEMA